MNRNVMIVLAGGFLIAVLVALLVQAGLSSGKGEPVVLAEAPKVQIIVAAKDLKIGAELSGDNMKWQDWPKNAVFPGALVQEKDKTPLETVSGRLLRDVKSGEPIVKSALVPELSGNFLAASLGEGKRAFAISVNAASMVGGFVGAGDYVDVLLTYKALVRYNGPENAKVDDLIAKNVNKLATETILENVKVMAVDQTAMRAEDEDKIKVGKTVTLEVDYKGVEILALSSKMGDLSLSLRRLGDDNVVAGKYPVTTDARVTNISDEIYSEMSKITGQASKSVRIYRGGVVENVSVSP